MPLMPAFCDTCSTVFNSGFLVKDSKNTQFSGCVSGPCPKCGGMGHIPDGVYDITGNVIKLLHGTGRTIKELKILSQILATAKSQNLTRDEVQKSIEENVPELNSLASVLPQTRNELYAFIAIILTAIGLIMAGIKSTKTEEFSDEKINKMIEHSIEDTINQPKGNLNAPVLTSVKQGRNDLCLCGSGKKYKKCCYLKV